MTPTGRTPTEECSVAIVCGQPSDRSAIHGPALIGGQSTALVAALACRAAGFSNITLYGSTTPPEPQTSIELSPNASRILRTLKVLEPLQAFCFEPQFVHQRSYRTGFQLSTQALGAMAEGRYNAPFLQVQNDALCTVLTTAAEDRGIKRVDAQVAHLSQNNDAITISTGPQRRSPKNSTAPISQTHDVLLVAGDPGDHLRRLASAEPLTHQATHYIHWQGQIAKSDLPAGAFGPVITQWLGPDHHLSYHFGADAALLHVSAISAQETGADEHPPTDARCDYLLQQLQHWHPSLRAMLAATGNLTGTPVYQTTPPARLAHGRILFLSNSCHTVLPHLPQQSALGMEDAWVAARMLEQWEDEPASGWVEYEKYRLPRARRVVTQAQRRAEQFSLRSPVKAWRRNLELTFGSRFLPELAMEKNDWLYGYDAVNGFE